MSLLANTQITMADGSLKNIQDIKRGDRIMGWDFKTKTTHPSVVVSLTETIPTAFSNYIVFDNQATIAVDKQQTIYCCEFECDTPIEDLQEGYHTLDIEGNTIEILAIHWDIESQASQPLFHLLSSNNTFFANNIMCAEKAIEKYRTICGWNKRYMSETIKNLILDESKDVGCFDFTITNKDFIKEGSQFYYQMQKITQSIKSLQQKMSSIDDEISCMTENDNVWEKIRDRIKHLTHIKNLKNEISSLQEKYNAALVKYSNIGEDILLDSKKRRAKYFQESVVLANSNFEVYSFFYPKDEKSGCITSDDDWEFYLKNKKEG